MESLKNTITKVINPQQYIHLFIISSIFSIIVHFFSNRRYNALKNGTNTFGFLPELMVYYRSLCKKGPFSSDPDSLFGILISTIVGALITGLVSVLLLLITDITLYIRKINQQQMFNQ